MVIEKDKILLSCENATLYGDFIWMTDTGCNELYRYNPLTGESEEVCKFDAESEYGKRLFGTIVTYKEYLYLIPFTAEKMYRVGISDDSVKEISLETCTEKTNNTGGDKRVSLSAHLYNDVIYILPTVGDEIISYNCKSEEINYYGGLRNIIQSKWNTDIITVCRKTAMVDESIYIPVCDANLVIIFNAVTNETDVVKVGSEKCRYSSICFDGENFWLSPRGEGPVVMWSHENPNVWVEYNDIPKEFSDRKKGFGDILYLDEEIVLLPIEGNGMVSINKNNRVMKFHSFNEDGVRMMSYCKDKNNLYIFSVNGFFATMDLVERKIERKQLYLPKEKETYHRIRNSQSYKLLHGTGDAANIFLKEEYAGELEDYIKYISRLESVGEDVEDSFCGKRILDIGLGG